jgi:hypothetical protein
MSDEIVDEYIKEKNIVSEMKYEDKIIILLLILFFTSVVCNVVFIKREMKYMYETEQFFSRCKAISQEEIQCHVPIEWLKV